MKKIVSVILCCLVFFGYSGLNCYAVEVPENTSIYIIPINTITSKNIDINTIDATIQNDVIIQGKTIFKAGDKATLNINEIEKARCWGKAGKLVVNNGYAVDTKGHKHKILISKNYYGEEKTWPKACGVISIFFLFPLALAGFVHGGQATISNRTEIETNLASRFSF